MSVIGPQTEHTPITHAHVENMVLDCVYSSLWRFRELSSFQAAELLVGLKKNNPQFKEALHGLANEIVNTLMVDGQ